MPIISKSQEVRTSIATIKWEDNRLDNTLGKLIESISHCNKQ
jgi:hypothetical protein